MQEGDDESLVVHPRRWPIIRRALVISGAWLLVFLLGVFGVFGPVPATHDASSAIMFAVGVVSAPFIATFVITNVRMGLAQRLAIFTPQDVGVHTGWAWVQFPWSDVSAVEKSLPTRQQFICLIFGGGRSWRDLLYQAHSAMILAEPLSDVHVDRLISYVTGRRPDLSFDLFWTARVLGGR